MENKSVFSLVKWAVIALFILVIVFSSFGNISTGERGVKTRLGAVVGTVDPGAYFKVPFIEGVSVMDVKTRTINYDKNGQEGDAVDTSQLYGASKDLQDVKIGVVVTYNVDPSKVVDIFSQYKSVDAYEASVIEPIVRKVVKATSAQFTAEELVTKRAEYGDEVTKALTEQFAANSATLTGFSVTNFEFSAEFTKAIEAKVTATQNAEAAKNKLEQIKYEAQQTIETAKATAEAQRIQAQSLAAQGGSDYVQLKALEKWDGHLPTQMVPGSTVPFINLKN